MMDNLHTMLRSIRGETKSRKNHITVFREFLDHLDHITKARARQARAARSGRGGATAKPTPRRGRK
jgi:hypothetical protein